MNYTKELADLFIKFGNELNKLAMQVEETKTEQENKEELLTKKMVLEKFPIFNESSLYRATNYNGLISYILIGCLMAIEFVIRIIIRKSHDS